MQEVNLLPREAFRYSVTVTTAGQQILWNFATRRKNITFGLFRRTDAGHAAAGEGEAGHVGTPTLGKGIHHSPSADNVRHMLALGDAVRQREASPSSASSGAAPSPVFVSAPHSPGVDPMPQPKTNDANLRKSAIEHVVSRETKPRRRSTLGALTAKTAQVLHLGHSQTPAGAAPAPGSSLGSSAGSRGLDQASVSSGGDAVGTLRDSGTNERRRQRGARRFVDPSLEPVLPLRLYESSKFTVKGSFEAPAAGEYVLVFDNTQSKNTSKRIYLFVAVKDAAAAEGLGAPVSKLMEGCMLKKKAKKLQGWAKRWVTVDSAGMLAYCKHAGSPIRGRVDLHDCMLHVAPSSRRIDLDAGTVLFHFRALSNVDYEKWSQLLGRFASLADGRGSKTLGKSGADPAVVDAHPAELLDPAVNPQGYSGAKATESAVQTHDSLRTALSALLEALEAANTTAVAPGALSGCVAQAKALEPLLAQAAEQISTLGAGYTRYEWALHACLKDDNRMRQQLGYRQLAAGMLLSNAMVPMSVAGSRSPSLRGSACMSVLSGGSGARANMGHRRQASVASSSDQYYDAEDDVLDAARASQSDVASGSDVDGSEDSSEGSVESDERAEEEYGSAMQLDAARAHTPLTHMQRKIRGERFHSISIVYSPTSDEEISQKGLFPKEATSAPPMPTLSSSALSSSVSSGVSAAAESSSSSLSSISDDVRLGAPIDGPAAAATLANAPTAPLEEPAEPTAWVPRSMLPVPTVPSESVNLFSILKRNIGKDLASVTMPVQLNEPLSLLQRLCEEFEYWELLDRARDSPLPEDRLALVAAFAVSGYASGVARLGRKPWNPLLGETFEYTASDGSVQFLAEKVAHHPPVMAFHATGRGRWSFFGESAAKTKFWGKSMEVVPSGGLFAILQLPDGTEELYAWNKLTSCVRNVFGSARYVEHYGDIRVSVTVRRPRAAAVERGGTAVVTFRESGMFGNGPKYDVSGVVSDADGQKAYSLSGRWDTTMFRSHPARPDTLDVLWRAAPLPPHCADMYGFTQFAVGLNELPPALRTWLPCTDTRLRPDQRLYEDGHVEQAEATKLALEQRQRERRKALEATGGTHEPRWFAPRAMPEWGVDAASFMFAGGYWDARATRFAGVSPPLGRLW